LGTPACPIPGMSSHLETLGQLLLESTRQVLEEAGVPILEASACAPAGDWAAPMAVIGFGGETVRGSISFEVPWRVLSASHPTKSLLADDLVDWVGELSNLVVGTLKTRLRGNSVTIQPGIPMRFTTREAERGATSPPQLQYRLRAADGSILVRFSAEIQSTFEMGTSTQPEVVHGIEIF